MAKKRVFISYTRDDPRFLEEIKAALQVKVDQGYLEAWEDGQIPPGERWNQAILEQIAQCDIFLMLINSSYMASEYAFQKEAHYAKSLAEKNAQKPWIIPIYVDHAKALKHSWVDDLQLFPSDNQTLQDCKNNKQDHIVIRELIEKICPQQKKCITPGSIKPLNALDTYDTFIQDLLRELTQTTLFQANSLPNNIMAFLTAIQKLTHCEHVAYYTGNNVTWAVPDTTHYEVTSDAVFEALEAIECKQKDACNGIQFNVTHGHLSTVIPIQRRWRTDNDDNEAPAIIQDGIIIFEHQDMVLDELHCYLLKVIFAYITPQKKATLPQTHTQLAAHLYDALKKRYRYVSQYVYESRFQLFKAEISQINMQYEPIIHFDSVVKEHHICAWEALARIGSAESAPANIFHAAELWGVRFKTELDLYVLERSIRNHKQNCIQEQVARPNEMPMLAINIYPSSLFQSAYREALQHLIAEETLLPGRKIILEISEKEIIANSNNHLGQNEMYDTFFYHMKTLSESLQISFAIDDFGTGNSSIVRLNQLKPEYIKIDRDLLHCDKAFAKALIANIVNVKHSFHGQAFKVIVEGMDEDAKLSLDELVNELNIMYVQGHLLSKASKTIHKRFNKQDHQRIKAIAFPEIPQ